MNQSTNMVLTTNRGLTNCEIACLFCNHQDSELSMRSTSAFVYSNKNKSKTSLWSESQNEPTNEHGLKAKPGSDPWQIKKIQKNKPQIFFRLEIENESIEEHGFKAKPGSDPWQSKKIQKNKPQIFFRLEIENESIKEHGFTDKLRADQR